MKKIFFMIISAGIAMTFLLLSTQQSQAANISAGDSGTATIVNDTAATAATSSNSYQQAKDTYQDALANYQSNRQDWLTAKSQYRNSKSAADLENALTKAKNHLIKTTNVMMAYLTAVKTRLENTENIDSSLLQSLTAEIDSDISWLQTKQAEINNAANKDDLIAAAATLKSRWDEIKARQQ